MAAANPCESTTEPSTDSPVWALGRHIPQLDGLRGLAILIVTLYRFSKEFPTDSLVGKLLHYGLHLGDRGVDLFFVLSGFLITGILVDAKGQAHYFSHFFARRSLRIFPLYFASLFLFVVAFNCLNPTQPMFAAAAENQFYLWTYLTNVKMSIEGAWCFGSLDHFWSLAVEEHFYLFWPLLTFSLLAAHRLAAGLCVGRGQRWFANLICHAQSKWSCTRRIDHLPLRCAIDWGCPGAANPNSPRAACTQEVHLRRVPHLLDVWPGCRAAG